MGCFGCTRPEKNKKLFVHDHVCMDNNDIDELVKSVGLRKKNRWFFWSKFRIKSVLDAGKKVLVDAAVPEKFNGGGEIQVLKMDMKVSSKKHRWLTVVKSSKVPVVVTDETINNKVLKKVR